MPLDLVNPFEEMVIVGKRYKVAVPPQSSTTIRAIVPTGRHVSHANKLGHWSGPSSGGKATRLERYTRGSGKVGKGFGDEEGHPTIKAPKGSYSSTDSPLKPKMSRGKKGLIIAGVGATAATGTGAVIHHRRKKDDAELVTASKAFGAPFAPPAAAAKPASSFRTAVGGVNMAQNVKAPKPPKPPRPTTSTVNSNIPAAASRGSRLP